MKLYIYDHCPYCVKARMIFGLKGLPLELITLLNDDVDTPVGLIGQKMVPILIKADGTAMPESMDIVQYVDALNGKPVLTGKANPAIAEWLSNRPYGNKLTMPRWVKAPLGEFATQGGRDYFQTKKEGMIGSFEEHLANSPTLKAQAEAHLKELTPLIQSPEAVNGTLSEDDIHLFASLRGLTIVKDLAIPAKIQDYLATMSARTGVPLYTDMAL